MLFFKTIITFSLSLSAFDLIETAQKAETFAEAVAGRQRRLRGQLPSCRWRRGLQRAFIITNDFLPAQL